MIRIREKIKAQVVFVIKFFLCFGLVRTDPYDGDVLFFKRFQCVPHILCLGGSAGGIGFGVEIKKQFLSGIIGKLNIPTILIFKIKMRSLVFGIECFHDQPPFLKG